MIAGPAKAHLMLRFAVPVELATQRQFFFGLVPGTV